MKKSLVTKGLHDFDDFHATIENYVMVPRPPYNRNGTVTIVEGLQYLPIDFCGFINDSVDRSSTPYSGPDGDYLGVPR